MQGTALARARQYWPARSVNHPAADWFGLELPARGWGGCVIGARTGGGLFHLSSNGKRHFHRKFLMKPLGAESPGFLRARRVFSRTGRGESVVSANMEFPMKVLVVLAALATVIASPAFAQ